MPLIVFTGFPSSGKSTWAQKLKQSFEDRISGLSNGEAGSNMKVILHSDESLGIPHNQYKESVTEKSLRGTQMSAVKRDLSRSNIVILDSPLYIKGFRYQLHCDAKLLSTTYCVVHVITPSTVCFEYNDTRLDKWDDDLLKQMIMRYEEPNNQNRWDSPLFNVAYNDETLPFNEIWDAIVMAKTQKPNNATVLKPATGLNFLTQLDKLTSEVINKIYQFQQLQSVGGEVLIEDDSYVYMPPTTVSIAQLQRFRRTYINLNRMRTVDTDRIKPLFVEYLNNALSNED